MIPRAVLLYLLGTVSLCIATCSVQYTVVSGDTCYAIWSAYGLSSTEFYKINPALSSTSCALSVGQSICVRSLEDAGTCSSYGAVSSGDTCSTLLQRYSPALSFSQLLALNSQINAGCSNLVPDQLLCFQGSPAQGSTSLPSTQQLSTISSSSTSTTSSPIQSSNSVSGTIGSTFLTISSSQSFKTLTSSSSVNGSSSSGSNDQSPSKYSSSSTLSSSMVPMPTSTSAPLNFTNSLPFSCNSTYTLQSNDTCASIAMSNSISISQLQMMNPTLSCSNVQAASSVCTRDGRDGCLAFTTIGSSDTCASLAARGRIGLQALQSYNPDLDCSSLNNLVNMPVCISAMPIMCSSSAKGTYQVLSNQTCSQIAALNNITVQDIIELNPVADCTAIGAGTSQLCILQDVTQSSAGRVNYQLLSLLVHAFQSQNSTLMPAYQAYMTAPTPTSVNNVMQILFPLFLPDTGQQELANLESSNPIMSSLETSYAGRTRSDYCTATQNATANTDAGNANTCFCGNSQPFLTCVSRLWSVYNSIPASSKATAKIKRDHINEPRKKPLFSRDVCDAGPVLEGSTEIHSGQSPKSSAEVCYEQGCCFPVPEFPLICWGFSISDCSSGDDTLYKSVIASDNPPMELVDQLMDEHLGIAIEICIDGVEVLEELGIDLCQKLFEMDVYSYRGDMEFIGEIGIFFIGLRFAGLKHYADYEDFHQCDGECTEDRPYCYADIGQSWFEGVSLVLNFIFWEVDIYLGGDDVPSCPSAENPPGRGITPSAASSAGKNLGAYYGNWNIWTIGGGTFSPIPDNEVMKLDSMSYAFATVSYYFDPSQRSTEGYYIDFTDWYGDIAKRLGTTCRAVDQNSICTDQNGAKKIAVAPYFGANGGGACPVLNCTNTQGPVAGGRSTPCQTLIDVSQLPVVNGKMSFCGQMIYVLDTLRVKNPQMKASISIGGWYDSNYFTWAAVAAPTRDRFVDSISHFVAYFGWDGVDIDWEFPEWVHGGALPPAMYAMNPTLDSSDLDWIAQHSPDDVRHIGVSMMSQYETFLVQLTTALGSSKSISIAAPAGNDKYQSENNGASLPSTLCGSGNLRKLIINLMTYDMHGAFDNPDGMTAHQAPLEQSTWYSGPGAQYTVKTAVTAWYAGGCSDIRLGIPYYGRAYLGVPAGTTCGLGQPFTGGPVDSNQNTILPSYAEIMSGGYSIYHDDANFGAAFGLSPSGEFVSFEDEFSLSQKLNYSIRTGLSGAFYWLAGNDMNGELTSFIWTCLQNSSSPSLSGAQCPGSPYNPAASQSQASSQAPAPAPIVSPATSQSQASTQPPGSVSVVPPATMQSQTSTQPSKSASTVSPASSIAATSANPSLSSGTSSLTLSSSSSNGGFVISASVKTSSASVTTSSSVSTTTSTQSSSSAPTATDLVAQWGTCGGQGYTGPTICAPPCSCKYISQCKHFLNLCFLQQSNTDQNFQGTLSVCRSWVSDPVHVSRIKTLICLFLRRHDRFVKWEIVATPAEMSESANPSTQGPNLT
jgi:GH18 family chitinase/LysM repeat protein